MSVFVSDYCYLMLKAQHHSNIYALLMVLYIVLQRRISEFATIENDTNWNKTFNNYINMLPVNYIKYKDDMSDDILHEMQNRRRNLHLQINHRKSL